MPGSRQRMRSCTRVGDGSRAMKLIVNTFRPDVPGQRRMWIGVATSAGVGALPTGRSRQARRATACTHRRRRSSSCGQMAGGAVAVVDFLDRPVDGHDVGGAGVGEVQQLVGRCTRDEHVGAVGPDRGQRVALAGEDVGDALRLGPEQAVVDVAQVGLRAERRRLGPVFSFLTGQAQALFVGPALGGTQPPKRPPSPIQALAARSSAVTFVNRRPWPSSRAQLLTRRRR